MTGLLAERWLLLTGATGFVGGAVRSALAREGWRVRCLTRDAAHAQKREPAVDWVQGDVADPASCSRALDGCRAALYLVHGIGAGADYHRHEVTADVAGSRKGEMLSSFSSVTIVGNLLGAPLGGFLLFRHRLFLLLF